MAEVTKQTKVQLVHGFKGPNDEGDTKTKEVVFRRAKAGDLKVMDGKGDHEGMICFAGRLTNLTPSMIENMDLEDYGLIMVEVRRFLEVLKPKS